MVESLENLYPHKAEEQRKRYRGIANGYESCFGTNKNIEFFSAPGRTEVGGNHTDHNHGCVLAAAVNLDIVAAAAKNTDNIVRLKSEEYPNTDIIDLSDLSVQENEKETSASLLRGICARCKELGFNIGGFNAFTASQVLKGSGLSSSAAFEVLVVTIISHLYNDGKISPVLAAQISQYAENVYFGKPSGLMDQTASSVGGFTAIDFKNPQKPILEKVNFDLEENGYSLCIVDTGGSHADLTADYAAIPAEMKAVAAFLGADVLRNVDEKEFYSSIAKLRSEVGDRAVLRAIHFFEENERAKEEVKALKDGCFEKFKELIIESGLSSATQLQNIFACSTPSEQGLSLALALSQKILCGKGAWRVHGGGFAGTVQAFVPNEMLSTYRDQMEAVFGNNTCHVLSVRDAGGVKVEI